MSIELFTLKLYTFRSTGQKTSHPASHIRKSAKMCTKQSDSLTPYLFTIYWLLQNGNLFDCSGKLDQRKFLIGQESEKLTALHYVFWL